jgi:hypothetical protein
VSQTLIGTTDNNTSSANVDRFQINSNDSLEYFSYSSAYTIQIITTQAFRDTSAWYYITLAVDTTQATAANRIKVYVNGVQVTAFGTATYPSLNYNTYINSAIPTYLGVYNNAGSGISLPFDGYLTELNFIDGQQLTPSSFGGYNSGTGVWEPRRYSGTYGTNGFYLNFNDNSAATAAAIGKDSSGNGNNWTPNNISVTAGVTYDSMLDVPTNTSATNANFCVINPINQSGQTITNGNLTAQWSLTAAGHRSTFAMDSGKWYWEVTMTSISNQTSTGIIRTDSSLTTDFAVVGSNAVSYFALTGGRYVNGTLTAYGATYATGDIIGVAVDVTNNTITFYKNGTSQGAITGLSLSGFSWYVASCNSNNQANQIANYNFGQRPFSYTPPTGFVALNTFNLPDPAVVNGATQFAVTTYTGTGATQNVTNTVNDVSFKPDFIWIKSRSNITNHTIFDSVRGINSTSAGLFSNLLDAEGTSVNCVSATLSNGFTISGSSGSLNLNTYTYVGWQWKASNATAVTNTSGSITSSVSANPTAGFSIVTYTGTGANATVGHGLGVAPRMILNKARNSAFNWHVYVAAIGNGDLEGLNTTSAYNAGSNWFNGTAPTSSVFSAGASQGTATYVSYCFAEVAGYSKFGSYTGTGNSDGNFVYLGFRPRFLIIKPTSTTGNWELIDTTRDTYNPSALLLRANSSAAQVSASPINDILSNGFKPRSANGSQNDAGVTYIYAAFAENPFKYSLAR